MRKVTAFMRPAPIKSLIDVVGIDWERNFVKDRHEELWKWEGELKLKCARDQEEAEKLRRELGLPDDTKVVVEQHFNRREVKIAFEAVMKQNLQSEESKTRSVRIIREDTLLLTEQDRPATLYQFLVCDDGQIAGLISPRAFD